MRWRTLLLPALLFLVGTCISESLAPAAQTLPVPDSEMEAPGLLPAGASADWWGTVQREIRAEEYHLSRQAPTGAVADAEVWSALNHAHAFRARFSTQGLRVVPIESASADATPAWEWGLGLAAWGRPDAMSLAAEPSAWAATDRLELRRPGLTEWLVNDERGIEHGFSIPAPPAESGVRSQEPGVETPLASRLSPHQVFLDLALSGTLHPRIAEDGQAVDFYDNDNISVIHYAGLQVTDAAGRILPSHLEGIASHLPPHAPPLTASAGGIRIAIDDTDALYPLTVDLLATSPSWTAVGETSSNWFGASVATAGDVNGDGYSDVVIGANGFSTWTGKAYLFPGGPSGLSYTPSWSVAGEAAMNFFGRTVATAGDVNGDGYSDVVVGADGYNTNTGKAYLYLGGPSGLSNTPSWTATGEATNNRFGWSLATAGDVNGDGHSDVIVGAYGYSGSSSSMGKGYVYLGGPSGLSVTSSWTAAGEAGSDLFGHSVATAGDVNGDGYSDVVVGADYYNSGTGKAYLYLGGPSGLLAAASWTAMGETTDNNFGACVAMAGDVNGDGYADVVVGAQRYSNFTGRAYLYLGGPSGLSAASSWTVTGETTTNNLGGSVATAGDVNGDGYADVLVGASGNNTFTGKAYLYLGEISGLSPASSWTAVGEGASNYFGYPVMSAGDVNGDGYSDVVTGANGYTTNTGKAYLYLGGPSGPSAASSWTAVGQGTNYELGYSVAKAGDVNGDGYADVVVGATVYASQTGKAYLYLGGPSGLSASASWSVAGEAGNDFFGFPVASAGDVNGDGYSEVLVGAMGKSGYTGKAYLYMGGASGLTAAPSWTAVGEAADSWFGSSVATAGDVNGDGYSDVVVGALGHGSFTGKVYLYLGGGNGLSAASSWTAVGQATGDQLGCSAAYAGDVNGDGYSDVVVGARGYSGYTGKAHLYLGSASGLSAIPSWSTVGVATDDWFGVCVATAGDVNGDGHSDVVVGGNGKAYLYLGTPSGLSNAASWAATDEMGGDNYGWSVASAGDVNSDGYSDLVVGAPYYRNGMGLTLGKAYCYLGSPLGLSATASWSALGEGNGDYFGHAVAAAGDVNGDGFSDIVIGARGYSANAGKVYLFSGGGGPGVPMKMQQLRADLSAPIAPLGLALGQQFRMKLLLRTPYGWGNVKLQWQALPLGASFLSYFNPIQSESQWLGSGVAGVTQQKLIALPDPPGPYKWRARVKYHTSSSPFQSYSRWFTLAANGLQETDLRGLPQVSCVLPDEPCWLYSVVKSGNDYTLHFQDPNQPSQRTGWNVRRSNDPSVLPKSSWPLVGSNVADMDGGAVNYQWTDHSGADPGPGGVWYYQVTAYNANCPAEGPF